MKRPILSWHIVIAVVCGFVAVAIGAYRLHDWRYFLVGDEYGFYENAKAILREHFNRMPYWSGVHQMNFTAVSMYQALFLAIEQSFWMWRFSNVILFLPIAVLLHVWTSLWCSARVGALSALFLSFSFFLHNYFLIGYPNPLALLFFLIMQVSWSVWAKNERNGWFSPILLGVITGITFYVYLGTLIILSVAPYVLFKLYRSQRRTALLGSLVLAGLIAVGLIAPAVLRKDALDAMFRVSVGGAEFSDPFQRWINVRNSFRLFWWNIRDSHFITGPYVDPITLVCIGFGWAYIVLTRRSGELMIVTVYVLAATLVGVTSPYHYPPITRGILIVPFGFIFAAIGLDWVTKKMPGIIQGAVFAGVLPLVVCANALRTEDYYIQNTPAADVYFLKEAAAVVRSCDDPAIIRVKFVGQGRPQNNLSNLQFFLSVQNGKEVKLYGDGDAIPTSAPGKVCELSFDANPYIK